MIAFRRGVGSASRIVQTPVIRRPGAAEGRVRPRMAFRIESKSWTRPAPTSTQSSQGAAIWS